METKAQHAEEVAKLKEENEVLLAKIAEMQPVYDKAVASRREQEACLELQVKIDESNAKTRQLQLEQDKHKRKVDEHTLTSDYLALSRRAKKRYNASIRENNGGGEQSSVDRASDESAM